MSLGTIQFFLENQKLLIGKSKLLNCNPPCPQNFVQMPKPLIDLGPYKGLITTWFQDDISCDDIAKRLADEHNIVCTGHMIKQHLKEWEITKRAHIVETVALHLKIA